MDPPLTATTFILLYELFPKTAALPAACAHDRMALPTLVDCVLLANTTAMLMLGSIAFAPSMAPDGELVWTSRGCPRPAPSPLPTTNPATDFAGDCASCARALQGKRLRKTNATQMGGLVMRFLAVSAWSLAALTSVCYVGTNCVGRARMPLRLAVSQSHGGYECRKTPGAAICAGDAVLVPRGGRCRAPVGSELQLDSRSGRRFRATVGVSIRFCPGDTVPHGTVWP